MAGRTLSTEMPALGVAGNPETRTAGNARVSAVILASFSLFYFADICLRASAKYFWFDELLTLYICRLPSLRTVYQATLSGVDYNPPLFHVLTRVAQAPFGEGLIASRMPSILGIWLLCVCLFTVVSKRSGAAAACVAMMLPLLAASRFYAYEARATGIVLGFAGLAALAWQRQPESRYRKAWLGVFGVSLLAAFLTHCYAIALLFPFGCAEAFRWWRTHRVDLAVWALMGGASLAALPFYVPLWHSFQRHVSAGFFPPSLGSLQSFYMMLLAPAALALVACLAAFAVDRCASPGSARPALLPGAEMVLALGFLALPAAGLLLAVAIHGPFIARYWFPAILGVSLSVGFASSGRTRWMAPSLAIVLACLLAGDFARLVRHRIQGVGEILLEPNTLLPMNTTPGKPLEAYEPLWANVSGDEPIVVVDGLEFAFLANYAPPQTRSRLYYLMGDDSDTVGGLLRNLGTCCRINYNFAHAQEFARLTPHFYVYGRPGEPLAALLRSVPPSAQCGSMLFWAIAWWRRSFAVSKRLAALLLALTALMLVLTACYRVLETPFWNYNGSRLMPSFAVARGINYYVLPHHGPLYCSLYGPLISLVYLPTTVFRSPNAAVLAGSLITAILCFSTVAFLHIAPFARRLRQADVLAFLTAGYLMCYLEPLKYVCFDIHADGPGLVCGGVACGALYYLNRKGRWPWRPRHSLRCWRSSASKPFCRFPGAVRLRAGDSRLENRRALLAVARRGKRSGGRRGRAGRGSAAALLLSPVGSLASSLE